MVGMNSILVCYERKSIALLNFVVAQYEFMSSVRWLGMKSADKQAFKLPRGCSKKSPPSELYVHRNTSRCLIRFTARFKKYSRRGNVTQNWTEVRKKGKENKSWKAVNAVVRVMGGGGRV